MDTIKNNLTECPRNFRDKAEGVSESFEWRFRQHSAEGELPEWQFEREVSGSACLRNELQSNSCFAEQDEQVAENCFLFLTRFALENKHILVAFSGGFDSMCLLHVLNKLKYDFNLQLTAIHLNHCWRGEESDLEEENCRKFAQSINVGFYSERMPDSVKHTENDAREARYEFFTRCAKKFNTDVVFTAHNYNDNAETLIYRIIKGTGIDGLKGISEHRGIFYRPLLNVKRAEIEKYCAGNNLTPNCDSSNKNTDFNRNHIRWNLLPEFEKINKDVVNALNILSQNARENEEIIKEYLSTLQNKFKTDNFIGFSRALQNRIIYEFLKGNGFEQNRKTVLKLVDFIKNNAHTKNGKKISIDGKNFLFVNSSEIRLIKAEPKTDFEIKINKEGEYKIGENRLIIEKLTEKPSEFPQDKENKACVDLSQTGIDFVLRTRKNGDIIQPLGVNGSQKFKKYLNEKGIPADLRDKISLLCKNNEVFWAVSVGISDKIKVINNPTHILIWK